jgi:hypothetical protein
MAVYSRFDAVSGQFNHLNSKFKRAFALPKLHQDVVSELIGQTTDCLVDHRKLLLAKVVFKRAGIHNPHAWSAREFCTSELREIEALVEMARGGRFDDIQARLADAFDRHAAAQRSLKEEKEAVLAARDRSQSTKTAWLTKQPRKASEGDLRSGVKDARRENEVKLGELNKVREEAERGLVGCAERVADVVERAGQAVFLPDGFESRLRAKADGQARKEWLRARIQLQRARNEAMRETVNSLQAEEREVREATEEKRREFEELQEKSKTAPPIDVRVNERAEKLAQLYYCQLCKNEKRERNAFFVGCGHSYCQECITARIKSRNRTCQVCAHNFDPVHGIQHIHWQSAK